MRIFITGGSGLVGSRLIRALRTRGDDVVLLTRRSQVPAVGDPTQKGEWMSAVHDCDAVVNLVGEGIFNHRWSAAFKETMTKSRVESTRNVAEALKGTSGKVLVSASAIGIYGPHGDEELTEATPPADDYLARMCVDWEWAARGAEAAGHRVVLLRVGVVLDEKGGALAKMLPPFKLFVGGPIGSGRQVISWIHHDDLVGLILFALDNERVSGPLNGTAPRPVTNKEFSRSLGRTLHRPSFLPTPAFALRVMLGEVAGVVTQGQRVIPKKALDLGYAFKHTELEPALASILSQH